MDFGEKSQRSERQSSSLSALGMNRDDNDPNRAGSSADDSQSVRSNQPIDFDHQINRSSLNFFDSDDEIEINAELFFAVRNGNLQEVQKLLKAGVKANIIDKNNKDNTLLHYAVERNKKEIVEKLLQEWNADVDAKNNKGDTPLHIAVSKDNIELVRSLLSKGATIGIKNNVGRTSLDIAKLLDKQDIIRILEIPSDLKPQQPSGHPDPKLAKQQKRSQETNKNASIKRRNVYHGNEYQLKLLMLVLFRGISHLYSFRLGTEIEEAKKFDDLVFEYIQGDKTVYRLLQVKHRLHESNKITADNLLTESDGDYSLIKYFFSYRDSKKEKIFKDGSIKDVIVFTNIDFDSNNLDSKQIRLEKIEDKDDILDVKSDKKQHMRYRFNEDVTSLLTTKLHDYNLTRLARRLAECFLQNKCIKHHESKDIFLNYHVILAKEVIDTTKKLFHDKFIKGSDDISEDAKKFRIAFKEEIKQKTKEKLTLENINEAITNKEKIIDDKQVGLTLSKNFGKGEDKNWPNNAISHDEVKDFLRHLVFAVNQPNEEELGNIVKEEIGEKFDLDSVTTKSVYKEFFVSMSRWFQGKEGDIFLSNEKGKAFFENARREIYKLVSVTLTKEYRAKVQKFGIEFSDEPSWLINFLSSHGRQILNLIGPHGTILSSIKVCQTLKDIDKYHEDDSYIFVRLSSVFRIQNWAIEAFKSNDLLVIECEATKENVDELYFQLSNEILFNGNKKIILITQENDQVARKFKDNFSDGRYEEKKDEKNSLSDLTYDSQQKLLKEGKVIFQGDEVSLETLVDDESKDLVEGGVLSDLIEGKEITIGTSLPSISDSNSPAYHKVMEEVDGHNLKNIKGDIFVVSGIDRQSLKGKLDIEQSKIVTYKELVFSQEIKFQFIILDSENSDTIVEDFENVCRQYQKSVSIRQAKKQGIKLIHLIEFKNDIFIWNRYYDPKFYIEREFNKIEIDSCTFQYTLNESSQDIFVFSGVQSDEFKKQYRITEEKIASTENELSEERYIFILRINEEGSFNIICQRHDNVHWIQQVNNKLIWKRSKGNMQKISELRKEINVSDIDSSHPEIYLVDVIKSERLAVIADVPGMGKSTTLVSLSEEYKKRNKFDWIIIVNLRDCENAIDKFLSSGNINTDTVANFIYEININVTQKLFARNLLKHKLVSNSGSGVLLLLDGFDEIRGDDRLGSDRQRAVVELLKFLKEQTNTKVLITTRPYERERKVLEDELSVLSYDFNPIADDQSKTFLERFWQNNLKLKYSQEDLGLFQYQEFAEALLDKSRNIFGKKEVSKFIGIPLQLRILSEAYLRGDKGFENNILKTNDEIQTLLQDLNISNLYKDFVDRKYKIYFDEKNRFSNIVSDSDKEELKKNYQKAHMRLAFKYYFADESQSSRGSNRPFNLFFSDSDERTFFKTKLPSYAKARELCKIGMIQIHKGSEGYKIDFDHRTFAEYFLSELICDRFQKKAVNPSCSTDSKKKMWEFLLEDIFIRENYNVIRNFINSNLLVDFDVYIFGHEDIVHGLLKDSIFKRSKFKTQLHIAAKEGSLRIAKFLLKNAPISYIAATADGYTALHYAVESDNIAIIEALLNCVKYGNNYKKIINALDTLERTPLSVACSRGNFKVVEFLVEKDADVNIAIPRTGLIPVHEAAEQKRWDIVEYLIENGANINTNVEFHGTLLHISIRKGGEEVLDRVKYLVEKGADVNIADPINGWTPALEAANEDRWDIVEYLIEKGANINAFDKINGSLLHIFCSQKDHGLLDRLKYLVEKNADVNIAHPKTGRTPALLAAYQDRWDIVEYLIEKGADINAAAKGCGTLLSIYIRQKRHELLDRVKYLVEKGANVNIADPKNGRTPALEAAYGNRWDIVECLIEKGADFNVADKYYGTLLHISIRQKGHELLDRVKYLVEKGADVNIFDPKTGRTPALEAAYKNRWDIVEYLIEKGAYINSADKHYITLLHISIIQGGDELLDRVKYLVEKDANVNIADPKNGRTPALEAAYKNRWDIVEYLIEKGANINAVDKYYGTLLHISIRQKRYDLLDRVKYLVESGANVNIAEQENGRTPALEAAYKNRWDIVEYLIEKSANINAVDKYYGTLLHIYIKQKRHDLLDRVKHLVEKEVDVSIADPEDGRTPALLASRQDRWDIVEYLIEKSANSNAADKYCTLLPISIIQKGDEVINRVKDLVEKDADVNIADPENGRTPALEAANEDRWDILDYLIEKSANINAVNQCYGNHLHIFIRQKEHDLLDSVKHLVEKGVYFNFSDLKTGWTPELKAVYENRWDIVEYLIGIGANYDAANEYCVTLLPISIRQKERELLDRVKYLVEKGADVNIAHPKIGQTPASMAALQNKWDIVEYLIEKGANINVAAEGYGTLLHISIRQGGEELLDRVKYLVGKGVDVNIFDPKTGWTPALEAAYENKWDIVEYLIEIGANINAAAKRHGTLLHISIRQGGPKVLDRVKDLVEKGADVNIADPENGRTPALEAANEDRWDVVEYLIEKGANINTIDDYYGTLSTMSIKQKEHGLFDRLKYLLKEPMSISLPKKLAGPLHSRQHMKTDGI